MQRPLKRMSGALIMVTVLMLASLVGRWIVATAPRMAHALATLTPTVTVSASPTRSPTATSMPTSTTTPSPTPTPTYTPTTTPTPTQKSTPTPMPRPSGAPPPAPTVILTATNSMSQPLPVPPPMPLVEQSDDVRNILVLGSDQPATGNGGLTDVIVVLSVNPQTPSASLLSIPRDFYAWIPSYGFDKINTAYNHGVRNNYPGGGPALVKATLEYNFGIPIHYYVRVGFNGFIKIVNALGGVEVAVECPLSDTFPDPDAPEGKTDVDWLPGIHHLDGKHALWYARSRWSTSDFDRNRRQQQILRGLYRQVLSLDIIPKIPGLWNSLKENVATDLRLDELLYLANVGARMDLASVKSRFVGRSVLQSWTAPNGGYVLVPYYDALGPLVVEALAPPATGRARQRAFRVEIWNATPYEELGYVAAERLRWEGFEVSNVAPADGSYPRTQIVDFTTSSKGSSIYRLMNLYKRTGDDVLSQPTEGSEADFRVILGADYDPCAATKVTWQYTEPLPTPTPLPIAPRTLTPTTTPVPQ